MYIHTYSILLCLPQKQQISEEPQLCIGIRAVYKEKSETRFKKKKKSQIKKGTGVEYFFYR